MDEFIDSLLREERVCDTILPRIPKRFVLEDNGQLEEKINFLQDELEELEELENGEENELDHDGNLVKKNFYFLKIQYKYYIS